MNKLYRVLLKRLGLTYPQYLVMMVLWEADHRTLGDIGDQLFLDSATLTPLLKRLQVAELITKVRDESDERHVIISLTKQGRLLKKQALEIPTDVFCATGMPMDEINRVKKALNQLRNNLFKTRSKP